MELDQNLVIHIVYVLTAPIIAGLLMGIDRKLTARMQNRMGPPLLQPFYDLIKLWGKEPFITNLIQPTLAFGYLAFTFTGIVLISLQEDLLFILYTVVIADVCLAIAAYSTKSPYSNLGGKRELLSMLAIEPIMVLTAIGVHLITGSFLISAIFTHPTPLLLVLPAAFAVQIIVLVIDMKKSPYDISGSGHAHQALVRGVYTEFSGYTQALVEFGHWLKVYFTLSLISLFWAQNIIIGAILAFSLFFVAVLIDNIYPRLDWKDMLKTSWTFGFLLILVNLIILVVFKVIK
jgi:ech hydrogenase subunit B